MKQVESAGIIVYCRIDNEVEYLLLHYSAGHWDFPKGKIEKGETKNQAALRELFEETGLHTIIQPNFEGRLSYFFYVFDGERAHKTVYFFVGQVKKQKIVLSREHQGFDWLPFTLALKQLTYDNAKHVLRKANGFIR